MNKSKAGKAAKIAPDRLAKIGARSGVELTESQLGQATGGATLKYGVKIDFGT